MSCSSAQSTYSSSRPSRSARVAVCKLCSRRVTGKPPWSDSSERIRSMTRSATCDWVIRSWGAMIAQSSAVDSSNVLNEVRGWSDTSWSASSVMMLGSSCGRRVTIGVRHQSLHGSGAGLDGSPDFLGGGGHVDVADAEVGECVDDGGLHGGSR